MTKDLQDLAWHLLPKESKEEVKEIYDSGIKMMDIRPSASQIYANKLSTLEGIFGRHNLTSDAEGEDEMLCVSRKNVQKMYSYNEEELTKDPTNKGALLLKLRLDALFGSKCLPDEGTDCTLVEPKPVEPFKVGDKVRIANDWDYGCKHKDEITEIVYVDKSDPDRKYKVDIYDEEYGGGLWYRESDLEPYTEPTDEHNTDNTAQKSANVSSNNSQDHIGNANEMVDTIIKDGFKNHNRLHIASIAMAGIMANPKLTEWQDIDNHTHPKIIAAALRYADALLIGCEKGGQE